MTSTYGIRVLLALVVATLLAAPIRAQLNIPAGQRALTVDVPASEFTIVPNPTTYAPVQISREGGKIVFSPNSTEPGNNFGFAETMLDDIPDSASEEANFLVVVVDLSFSVPNNDRVLPTFRVRLNQLSQTDAFIASATTEMVDSGYRHFQQVAALRLPYDRNRLIFSQRDMLLALDFYNFTGANADPDFEVTVEDVRYYITKGDAHSTPEITTAYLTDLGNLFWKLETRTSTELIQSDVEYFAYDDQYLVALDYTANNSRGPSVLGELHGYMGSDYIDGSGSPIEIADSSFDVREVAVNGPYVTFLTGSRDVYVWDFNSQGVPLSVDLSGIPETIDGVMAADDHATFQLYAIPDTGDFTLYELTRDQDFTILNETPVVLNFAAVVNGRNMLCLDTRSSAFP